MRILIVEDDLPARKLLRFVLEEMGGYAVLEAGDAREGREQAPDSDLVVTDLNLPGADGFSLCKHLRARSAVPILAVSATRVAVADRVQALRVGADDYLAKPFDPNELLARIEALARRSRLSARVGQAGAIRVGDLELDLLKQSVTVSGGQPIPLTPNETRILARLAQTPGKPVTREALQQALWGSVSPDTDATVTSYMAALRRKLEADPKRPRRLVTVRGAGYRLA